MSARRATTVPLSREIILAAALTLADAEGVEAVSMRRVAEVLGCGTMSLYTHVANKEELLGGMLEAVVGQIELPGTDVEWPATMRRMVTSTRDVLTAHPWACRLWHTTWPGRARTSYMEGILRGLRESGFSPRMAHHGYHLLDLYAVGYVHTETSLDLAEDPEEGMARFLAQTPVATFPYMIEHVAQHAGDGSDDDFDFMLGLILEGLERHRDVRAYPTSAEADPRSG